AASASSFGSSSNAIHLTGGTFEAAASFTVANPVSLGVSGTFSVDAGRTLTQLGAISGSGNIIKTGPGTLRFQTVQSPLGSTIDIDQGKLLLASNGAIAGNISTINVNTGASLELDNSTINHVGRIVSNL